MVWYGMVWFGMVTMTGGCAHEYSGCDSECDGKANTNRLLFFSSVADQGKPTEEKFHKLKQMYSKLRTEHVQLLRTVSFRNSL